VDTRSIILPQNTTCISITEVSGHFGSTADVSYGHFGDAAGNHSVQVIITATYERTLDVR